jgi:hypothetical protein
MMSRILSRLPWFGLTFGLGIPLVIVYGCHLLGLTTS